MSGKISTVIAGIGTVLTLWALFNDLSRPPPEGEGVPIAYTNAQGAAYRPGVDDPVAELRYMADCGSAGGCRVPADLAACVWDPDRKNYHVVMWAYGEEGPSARIVDSADPNLAYETRGRGAGCVYNDGLGGLSLSVTG